MDDVKRSLGEFLARIAQKGWPAVELKVRVGEASELVDQYALAEANVDLIWADMMANAQGVTDPVSSFFVRALGNGDKRGPSRSFSVVNDNPPHQADRFEATDKAALRMMMEHAHRSHLVVTNALAQVTQALQSSLGGQLEIQGQMAQTHGEAIAALREARAETAEAEVRMMEAHTKAERTGKLMEAGMALLPALIERLNEPDNGGGSGGQSG